VTNPAALTAVLTGAGLTGQEAPTPEGESAADPGTAAAASSAPAQSGAASMALAAGIAGVILGTVGTLLLRRARPRGDGVLLSG
jgi:hypothetical protein